MNSPYFSNKKGKKGLSALIFVYLQNNPFFIMKKTPVLVRIVGYENQDGEI